MLSVLRAAAQEGRVTIADVYLGHLKKVEDQKVLAHSSALRWEQVDGELRALLESYLHTVLDGEVGKVNFLCHYKPELRISVAKLTSTEFDAEQNKPAVELLEAMRDVEGFDADRLVQLGNVLSYKVMAAGAVKNEMLVVMRLQWTAKAKAGAKAIPIVFATHLRLDDRYESLLDEQQGRVVTTQLFNVLKRGPLRRGALFPCLNDDLHEAADVLVYAGTGARAWFKALEVEVKAGPKQESKTLMKLIADQAPADPLPPDFLEQMGTRLKEECADGLAPAPVAEALETVVGRGVNRKEFEEGWTREFGSADYRISGDQLFGSDPDPADSVRFNLQAGTVTVSLFPTDLKHFRQVTVGPRRFLVMEVPEKARLAITRGRHLLIQENSLDEVTAWMQAKPTNDAANSEAGRVRSA